MAQPELGSSSLLCLGSSNTSRRRTLWMGSLEPWMDEGYLGRVWHSLGEHVLIKLIRDKRTGVSSGYAFVEFDTPQRAQHALHTLQGIQFPNMQRAFQLNWASGGGINDLNEDRPTLYSLFVGDLCNQVDDTMLFTLFHDRYPSCQSAKVMIDPATGCSRGYGFVRFLQQGEQHGALKMNGVLCGTRPMRISFATPKNTSSRFNQLALKAPALVQQPADPNNTTVFIGGLSLPVPENELRDLFARFGEIVYVKVPAGKGCGFVQYVTHEAAEYAIEQMNGFTIGRSRIRLSWGRSQSDKAFPSDQKNALPVPFPTFPSPSILENTSRVSEHGEARFDYTESVQRHLYAIRTSPRGVLDAQTITHGPRLWGPASWVHSLELHPLTGDTVSRAATGSTLTFS